MDSIVLRVVVSGGQDTAVTVRDWVALVTGLNLAFALCTLICKAPEAAHPHSLAERLLTSAAYLGLACLLGAGGTWIVLRGPARAHLRLLVRCGFRAWIFLPAIVVLLSRQSEWAPLLAMVAAVLMAAYLGLFTEAVRSDAAQRSLKPALFTTEIHPTPASWSSFTISVCLYGFFLEAVAGRLVLATVLLATAAFLLALQITTAQRERERAGGIVQRRSRHYALIVVALACTLLALSGAQHGALISYMGWARSASPPRIAKQQAQTDHGSSGYQTIVLWPPEKKEKTLPSPPLTHGASSGVKSKPWVIPFDGPYWYFKFAGETPGVDARTTRGDPLKVNVRSTDRSPLLMEAHQHLAEPLPLDCCRALQIVLRNDAALGALAVGLTLTDSHARRSQSLGLQSLAGSAPVSVSSTASPTEATLLFPIPKHGMLKSFDALTVTLLPDPLHQTAGRKVAIERFVVIPN